MRLRVITLLLISTILLGCGQEEEASEPTSRVVKLFETGTGSEIASRRFVGRVEALSTVDLSFQVEGRLVEFPAVRGSIIPQGEPVARLDPTDYRLAVRRAEAERELARSEMERNRRLLEYNAVSQAVFDEARTNYELADVQLDHAHQELAYTTIHAPFDALVTRRMVDNHTTVQAGMEVVRVQDVSELRIRISLPETLMSRMLGDGRFDVEAELLSLPGWRLPLEYREHITEPDEFAQTYEVEFAVSEEIPFLALPGMTAAVTITSREGATESRPISVPVHALSQDESGNFRVWMYDAESETVSPRAVEVGEIQGDRVPVLDGLQPGERIVAAGAHLLREGMRVRPLEASL